MESAKAPFDDEGVRVLLIGSESELRQGLELIDHHLRKRICGWVRKRFPGLPPEDLADTWGETLAAIIEAVRDERFDPDRPLVPWICTIAERRATDRTRRTTTRDRALSAIAENLRGTSSGRKWKFLDDAERREVADLIREAVSSLPPQQRKIMQVFVDNYPDTASTEVLREEVSKASSREETVAAVKRALQEGRRKVREHLQKKGYDLGQAR